MAHGIGHSLAQDAGIQHHHRAGDGGHARGHQRKQFAAAHFLEVGPDEKRRLHHADEDIGDRAQRQCTANAQRFLKQPGKPAHDQWQDAPVEQQGRQGADQQDQRQGAKRQDEAGTRAGLRKRRVAAAR